MTVRLREAQQGAVAAAHVGRFLADRMRPLAKTSEYDERARVVRVVGHRDQALLLRLDQQGNVTEHVTPLGRVTRFGYASGLQVSSTLPAGLEIRTAYDGEQRPTTQQRSDGESLAFSYDKGGRIWQLTLGEASPMLFSYDEHGHPVRVTERDGSAVNYDYDDTGRVTRVADPLGRVTQMQYGLGSQPTTWIEPDGTRIEYEYEGSSIAERYNGRPRASYGFDDLGRLESGTYIDGYSFEFARDDEGRVTAAKTPDSEVTLEYDDAGRLCAEIQNGRAVRYHYDIEGQLVAVELPDGQRQQYEYDLDGRVSGACDGLGAWERFGYGAAEQPSRRDLPSGLTEAYYRDQAGRLTGVDLGRGDQYVWWQRYARDRFGRLQEHLDSRHGGQRLEYDAQDRLVAVRERETGRAIEAFAFDAATQRVGDNDGGARFDAMGRVLTQRASSFAYDTFGNRLSQTSPERATQYTWVGPGRLATVELAGPVVIRFKYDAFGRRIEKESPTEKVTYIWAGRALIQEVHESAEGSHSVEYLYFPGSHRLLAKTERGRTYRYHCDQLDTPQLLTDDRAAVVWSARVAAFGAAKTEVDVVAQPWRLPGQYCDDETGLHYNFARYYDAETGSYLSRDPAATTGTNAYVYAGGNPLNIADPLGLFWEDKPGWFKTAVSVGAGLAVGIGVGLLVAATAPVSLTVLGVALGAGALGLLAGGVAGGMVSGGLDAAMTKDGCVLCGVLRGGAIGLIATLPFLALPATAGYFAFATAGAASGAIGYLADVATSDHEFTWGGFGLAVGMGAGLGVAGKFIHGLIKGGPEVPMEGGEPPAAGEKTPEPVHRENIGKNLPPEEAARIMDERTQSVAEDAAEQTRARTDAQEQRAAERQADKDALDQARKDATEKGKRVGELKKDPNATQEQIDQAKQEAREANANRDALANEMEQREQLRQADARNDPPNRNGAVFEPAYDPETGEMVVANQSQQPAPHITRPAESLSESTAPGQCAMPQAASILTEEAAQQGRPRPDLITTEGGKTVRGGEVHPIDQCPNCRAIVNQRSNQITSVPKDPYKGAGATLPGAGEGSHPTDRDGEPSGTGSGGASGFGANDGAEGSGPEDW